jgi:hypothetical protein
MVLGKSFEELLGHRMMVLKVIWMALTASILVYAGVGYIVSVNADPKNAGDVPRVFQMSIFAVAVMTALGSVALKTFLFSPGKIEARLVSAKGDDKEQRLLNLFGWYFPRYIVILALDESVAVYGLVLTLVTLQPSEMIPFMAVALFLNARVFMHPRNTLDEAESILSRSR